MEPRGRLAAERHARGYNCAQAVACTYADLVGMEERALFAVCEGLGLGLGGMEGSCGALSGACVLAGIANSTADLGNPSSKKATYLLTRRLTQDFRERAGAIACHDLKGRETGKVLSSCPRCIQIACELVEEAVLSGSES